MITLSKSQWKMRVDQHFQNVTTFAQKARKRASQKEKHPIYDFLTLYYPFSLGKLEKWHPSHEETLADPDPDYFTGKHYQYESSKKCFLDPLTLSEKEQERHTFTLKLLEQTQERPALHSCFGLHEWAMVYKEQNTRHRESAPLRLSPDEINQIVESRPLVCTHFDAFRFFTSEAKPLNRHQPKLDDRLKLEQPGCIHANMDLYKWSFKSLPWVGSELVWECFSLALKAREIDMRASPYDLKKWNYAPIYIETETGRAEYLTQQKEIESQGKNLRKELIKTLSQVLKATKQKKAS